MSLSITRHNKMFRFASFLFISSCISLVISEISTNNFCDSKWCPFPYLQHTACGNSGVSWKIRFSPNICKNFYLSKIFNPLFCPSDIHFVKLSKALKQFILDSHNQYRMMVALGLQERYPVTTEWGFLKLLMNLHKPFPGFQWNISLRREDDAFGVEWGTGLHGFATTQDLLDVSKQLKCFTSNPNGFSSHDSCHNTEFNSNGRLLKSGQNIAYFYTYSEPLPLIQYIRLGIMYWFDEFLVKRFSFRDM